MSSALAANKVNENTLTQTDIRLKYLFEQGVDFRNRSITLDGDIGQGDFRWLDAAMNELEYESRKAITLKVNSPGGSIYDAMAIVGRLKASNCNIITEGYGHMMSAAALILACGHRRRVSKYAWFMVHEMSYEIYGKHSDIKDAVRQSDKEQFQWAQAMSECTGTSAEEWLELVERKETYLTAEKCVEFNIADEVI